MTNIRTECTSAQCRGKPPALSLNTDTGIYYCFRCKDKGKKKVRGRKAKPNTESIGSPEPPESKGLSFSGRAYTYLVFERGVAHHVLMQMPVRETQHGILFEFPGFTYWQERRWDLFRPPPWQNPPGDKDGVFYNVGLFPTHTSCVLVEGIVDALKVGEFTNCVAILGKEFSDAQARRILTAYPGGITVFLDSDTLIGERNAILRLLRAHSPKGQVSSVACPFPADPASLPRARVLELVGSSVNKDLH